MRSPTEQDVIILASMSLKQRKTSPLTPWLPPYFACTRTKALSNAKNHAQTKTKPRCNKRKVVLDTGDATTVCRPPVTARCMTEKFRLQNSNAACRGAGGRKKKGFPDCLFSYKLCSETQITLSNLHDHNRSTHNCLC